MRKKILYLANNLNPVFGGAETAVEQFLDNLDSFEHMYLGNNPIYKEIFRNRKNKVYPAFLGFEPVTLKNLLIFPITIIFSIFSFIKNLKLLTSVDVFYQNLPSFTEVFAFLPLISIFLNKPIVLVVRLNDCPRAIYQNPLKFIFQWLIKQPNLSLVFVSKDSHTKWNKYFDFKDSKVSIIYNGTRDYGLHSKKTTSNSNLKILWVGRIHPEKDLETLFRALGKYNLKIPIDLSIYGQGEESYELKLKHWATEITKDNSNIQIHFAGHSKNMKKVYANYELVIFSSLKESFGRILIESWMAGIPVISSNLKVFEEIYNKTKISKELIFEAGNSQDLLKKLNYYIKNRQQYLNINYKKQLNQKTKEVFGIDKVMIAYSNLLQKNLK
jgi:glycosyltransferase involved in cell wall biosynthesis